jgi:hypothetical protein
VTGESRHWTNRAWQGLLLLLVIAIGARVVYGLLVPLLPFLGGMAMLVVVFLLAFSRRH